MPISALRNAVAGARAVVDVQRRLRFKSTSDLVENMLNAALDIVRAECGLHEAVAPDRTGTRQWSKKVELLDKALEWLRKTHLKDDPSASGAAGLCRSSRTDESARSSSPSAPRSNTRQGPDLYRPGAIQPVMRRPVRRSSRGRSRTATLEALCAHRWCPVREWRPLSDGRCGGRRHDEGHSHPRRESSHFVAL